MQKSTRTYEVDTFIQEMLKLVAGSPEKMNVKPAEAPRLEKKDVQTTRDMVLKLIDSLKKA